LNYAVEFAAEARKDFARLDRERKSKIASRIDQLAVDPMSRAYQSNCTGLRACGSLALVTAASYTW
jgi:mRNA-degrading endonuclease RelE of RelBE toxin-antitoxin system